MFRPYKTELPEVGIFFRTQFLSLGISINKKLKIKKLSPPIIQLSKLIKVVLIFQFLTFSLTKISREGN